MHKQPTVTRVIHDEAESNRLLAELGRGLDELRYDRFHVLLATKEAVMNALQHGNRRDSTKAVTIRYRCSPSYVWIQIEDEGEGFTPALVPDPTKPENYENEHGRGLLLMRKFMTDVQFNERGNCVTMQYTRRWRERWWYALTRLFGKQPKPQRPPTPPRGSPLTVVPPLP